MSTLVALTDIPKSNEWKDALTRPLVETTVGFMKNLLPDNWVQKLSDSTDIRQLNK
jgi:membrane protein required for colicin V production